MAKRRNFTPEFKAEVVIEALCGESSQAELCRKHNLSDVQLSKWKRQLLENAASLFEPIDKQTNASQKLTLELDIQKSLDLAELTPAEKRGVAETLRTDYSVRQICDTLGFNRSSLYYEPIKDPCEAVFQKEIEKLSARYPRYGYRRPTEELLRPGYTVGYRRVARLMKSANLLVSVKRSCQTTKSVEGKCQWGNRLTNLDICRRNQVWVADVT